jgi:hypothetical protein
MSETGLLEFFIYPSNNPKELTYKQSLLLGKAPLP